MKFSLLFLFIALFATSVFSNETLNIIASDSIPPYVMPQDQIESETPGLQVEIINSILNTAGYKTNWKLMPNNRIIIQYKSQKVDAALNLPFLVGDKSGFSSDSIIDYKNCVIGQKSLVNSWKSNLNKLKVLGHQKAKIIYKDIFDDYNFDSEKYNEVTSQKTLAYHLINDRTDIVLSDYLVFSYYVQNFFQLQFKKKNIVCLEQVSSPRSVSFKSKKLKELFNKGLNEIKKNGIYEKIVSKYYEKYPMIGTQPSKTVNANFIFA